MKREEIVRDIENLQLSIIDYYSTNNSNIPDPIYYDNMLHHSVELSRLRKELKDFDERQKLVDRIQKIEKIRNR